MNRLLKQIDKDRVATAVLEAEGRTSGEIVPYVVARSGSYDGAVWRGAALVAVALIFATLLVYRFYEGWGLGWLHAGWGMALVALGGGTAGALVAAYVAPVTRWLAGTERIDRAVHRRALQAFVEEEVFATRERTGILIFVSLFERRIEVMGDAGINRKVTPEDWIHVVERIRDGIKSGRVTEGLVEAIALCGALLERKDVEIRPDDTDELSNKLRIRPGDA